MVSLNNFIEANFKGASSLVLLKKLIPEELILFCINLNAGKMHILFQKTENEQNVHLLRQ